MKYSLFNFVIFCLQINKVNSVIQPIFRKDATGNTLYQSSKTDSLSLKSKQLEHNSNNISFGALPGAPAAALTIKSGDSGFYNGVLGKSNQLDSDNESVSSDEMGSFTRIESEDKFNGDLEKHKNIIIEELFNDVKQKQTEIVESENDQIKDEDRNRNVEFNTEEIHSTIINKNSDEMKIFTDEKIFIKFQKQASKFFSKKNLNPLDENLEDESKCFIKLNEKLMRILYDKIRLNLFSVNYV